MSGSVSGAVAGVSGLTLRYGKVTALDDVTLEIPSGRIALFITTGERVKVDTRSGDYLGRVNS